MEMDVMFRRDNKVSGHEECKWRQHQSQCVQLRAKLSSPTVPFPRKQRSKCQKYLAIYCYSQDDKKKSQHSLIKSQGAVLHKVTGKKSQYVIPHHVKITQSSTP